MDGDINSYWKSKKATGRNVLPAEWIIVDLGNIASINQVILRWHDNFATNYTIDVSENNNTWVTVFSTTSGNGGNDVISIPTTSARYVRMNSTQWYDASYRVWLREFEIYGYFAGSTPTNTPTPTPSATPVGGQSLHVGDLDGSSTLGSRGRWNATVSILVHDASENPVVGATVSGSWSGGISGSDNCTTDAAGRCSITKTSIKSNLSGVMFAITNVVQGSSVYQPADNHDPDGDSNGTNITILKP